MFLKQFRDLLFPGHHSALVQRRRALLITSRVRMVAGTFGALTPLWIPVDMYFFPAPLGAYMSGMRMLAALAFLLLSRSFAKCENMALAHRALALLLSVPVAFFLISQPLLASFDIDEPVAQAIAASYAYLPFVMIAGLSVFPITAIEGFTLALPLLLANLIVAFLGMQVLSFASHVGALWLLALLSAVATLAGMSQLHFMLQLISQASHDGLTKAYNRRVGEELLALQFSGAERTRSPLAVVFIDLDDFKAINDRFGHEEGDDALRQAALALRRILRRADVLVRWGGEEFIVVMPNTDLDGVRIAVQRLRDAGLGKRPDGSPLTASVGAAERLADHCDGWPSLVEKADRRMYTAKQSGKNHVVLSDDGTLL